MIRSAVNRAGCKLKPLKTLMQLAPKQHGVDPILQAERLAQKQLLSRVTDMSAQGEHQLELQFRLEVPMATFKRVQHQETVGDGLPHRQRAVVAQDQAFFIANILDQAFTLIKVQSDAFKLVIRDLVMDGERSLCDRH